MKAIKFTSLLVIALALTFAATGCKKKPVGVTNITKPGTHVVDPGMKPIDGGTIGTGTGTGTDLPGGGPLSTINLKDFTEDTITLAKYTIHFAYDSSVIRSSDKASVSAVAAYMKENPGVSLQVAGNADERGTEEYNRSLGDRRALAGREALVADGVDGQRITTISYGKDRPVEPGNSEAAWSKNRRDDFVVLRPK
jgi:peptidoglycan-associated lipoprotein